MSRWEPPAAYGLDAIRAASDEMLARPGNEIVGHEDIFRISSLGLEWDMAGAVYEPADPSRIPVGPDGKKIGVFMQHGGEGDYRAMTPRAQFLAEKLGYRVFCMTMPGKLYFPDPDRAWPGDTINPDGTARTPLWKRGLEITPDQYELVQDRSDPEKRAKWGTLFFLQAKEGTEFHHRMASWPVAFDDAIRDACARHFPDDEWTIYVHGHSTGGPFVHNMLQRIDNVAGLIGMESSPFGAIYSRMLGMSWDFPFTYLTVRTWRHIAKYAGTEAGPEGCKRLPWLMEDVFEAWDRAKSRPQLKGEYIISYGAADTLEDAGRATASRLGLDPAATEELVARYRGYAAPLEGAGTRAIPPLLYGIAAGSRDHGLDRYENVVLPTLAALDRPPKARVVRFEAGVHSYTRPEPGLPRGLLPAIAAMWDNAIQGGYYLDGASNGSSG